VFDAIMGNITFAPIVPATCPVHKNSGYGASAGNPIKIGGALREGEQRINDYLDSLLGPKGEFVSYYRDGTEEVNGVNVERYNIEFGSTWRTLYFDIYSYNPLSLPVGYQCSAPLPNAP
jgi:hypothetical protein